MLEREKISMEQHLNLAPEEESLKKELVHMARKNKLKRKIISGAIVAVLVLLTVACAWLYGRNQGKDASEAEIARLTDELAKKDEEIQKLNEMPIVVSPAAPEIKLDIVYSEIQNIAELATIEYLFTDAAEFSDSKQIKNWNIPFTEKSFIIRWDGVIKAGVKLDQVTIEVNETAGKITVSMPKAEILSYEIDHDSIEVLDEKNNIFNPMTVEDKVKFDSKTEEAMKERAIENGLLEKAQENAKEILERLVIYDSSIKEFYTVEFVIQG